MPAPQSPQSVVVDQTYYDPLVTPLPPKDPDEEDVQSGGWEPPPPPQRDLSTYPDFVLREPQLSRFLPKGHARWHGCLCACCGPECDGLGWRSWLLACCCPCIAFGRNENRAFGRSVRAGAWLFFSLFFVLPNLVVVVFTPVVVSLAHCHAPAGDNLQQARSYMDDCRQTLICVLVAYDISFTCLVLFANYEISKRRTEMRERFGIPGSRAGDYCTWLLCPTCALSQETRTLRRNNVSEGVWHGADDWPLEAPLLVSPRHQHMAPGQQPAPQV